MPAILSRVQRLYKLFHILNKLTHYVCREHTNCIGGGVELQER
jgi:hypothetical protein